MICFINKVLYFKDADRIRRDSVINEEVPKTEPVPTHSTIVKTVLEETKIEIAKPGIVTDEEIIKQNNIENDLGMRAEALYDYQAGNILIYKD